MRFILALILFRATFDAYFEAISLKLCFKNPNFCLLTSSIFSVSIYSILSFCSGSSSEFMIFESLFYLLLKTNSVLLILSNELSSVKDFFMEGSKV